MHPVSQVPVLVGVGHLGQIVHLVGKFQVVKELVQSQWPVDELASSLRAGYPRGVAALDLVLVHIIVGDQ